MSSKTALGDYKEAQRLSPTAFKDASTRSPQDFVDKTSLFSKLMGNTSIPRAKRLAACGECGKTCPAEVAADGGIYCHSCWLKWDGLSTSAPTSTSSTASSLLDAKCGECGAVLPAGSWWNHVAEDGGRYCQNCWSTWDSRCQQWTAEQKVKQGSGGGKAKLKPLTNGDNSCQIHQPPEGTIASIEPTTHRQIPRADISSGLAPISRLAPLTKPTEKPTGWAPQGFQGQQPGKAVGIKIMPTVKQQTPKDGSHGEGTAVDDDDDLPELVENE